MILIFIYAVFAAILATQMFRKAWEPGRIDGTEIVLNIIVPLVWPFLVPFFILLVLNFLAEPLRKYVFYKTYNGWKLRRHG